MGHISKNLRKSRVNFRKYGAYFQKFKKFHPKFQKVKMTEMSPIPKTTLYNKYLLLYYYGSVKRYGECFFSTMLT